MARRGAGARKRRTQQRAQARQRQARRPADLVAAATLSDREILAVTIDGEPAEFAVSGSTTLPLGPRTAKWDAAAADKATRTWAGVKDKPNAKYDSAFFWNDGSENLSGRKLQFAEPEGGTLTANWGGITAVAGALQGARGGVDIPDADKAGIKTKVAGYYAKAAKAYKDTDIKVPWAASNEASIQFATERGLEVISGHDSDQHYIGVAGDFDSAELVAVQRAAAAQALAYAECGPDADPAELAIVAAMWGEALAAEVEVESLEAAAGDLVWDDEDGFMDLIDDLNQLLNGTGYGWRVIDVALTADRAIVCCYRTMSTDGPVQVGEDDYAGEIIAKLADTEDGPGYYLVPFTIGDDKEPVLSDTSEWTRVEEGWVKSTADLTDRMLAAFAVMAACANCSHPAGMHGDTDDGDNMGACSSDGCDCSAYETKSASAPVTVEQLREAAMEALEAGDPDFIRMRLEDFTVHFADVEDTLPDAHKPGSRVPPRRRGPSAPAAPVAAEAEPIGAAWSAILAPEGKLTSDRRAFAPGSIAWPRLDDGPLSLMAMTVTSEGGHVGAELCGQIQKIWRDDAAGVIRASGVFDSGDYGQEIARLVDDRTLRGVSVDLAVGKWDRAHETDYFDDDGAWAPKDEADRTPVTPVDLLYGEGMVSVVLAAEIGAVTVCPFPAFGEAQIAVGDSLLASAQGHAQSELCWTVNRDGGWLVEAGELAATADCGCEPVLTASAEGLTPETPPAAWFADPELLGPTALEVDESGRIFGHAALWGVCHIGLPGQCRTAPHSNTDYAYFHLGKVEVEDGEQLDCGQITLDTGHAARGLDASSATAHYDHTGTVVAHVRVGEDEHGIWVAGALQHDAPAEKVRLLRGSKLSGDWRKIDGNLELVALLCVNVPGFPVPRASAQLVASADGVTEVFSLVAAGIPFFEAELTPEEREAFAAIAAQAEFDELAAA